MPSRNTYRLTWVSLTSDVGYLFTAAPAKRQPMLLLTLDKWYLLMAAHTDLEHGVAPLGPPAPTQVGSQETPGVTGKFGLGVTGKFGL